MKDCNQCGKCCTQYSDGGLSATEDEIDFWELFRPNIAEYVANGKIWMDPKTGRQLTLCPWLRKLPGQEKYSCDIYYDRPDDCKLYPVKVEQMIADECEMLEAADLDKPERAQAKLDRIMAINMP